MNPAPIRRPRRSSGIGLRSETAADEALVRRAHVEHRRALFGALPWPEEALERLCEQQHDLQERHIAVHNPQADRLIIEVRGEPVGRLCLERTTRSWHIVDIALVPEAQGRGTGSAAIRRVLSEAGDGGATVELQVALDNPRAEALYRRLGFRDAVGSAPTHRRLLWSSADAAQLNTA